MPGRLWTRTSFTLLLALALCLGLPCIVRAQPDMHDYSRITQVPRAEIDAWLKQEVRISGGDWDKDRYHLFLGFSTGHFGQDPVHAIAMRRLAFSIVNNSLSVGDRVTPIAWEMETWDVGPTVTLTEDAASRAEFANRVPYTPRSGSHGGHDIERALFETITKAVPADERGSAIILLLTNSNASQAPTGEQASLFGANNPELADALKKGKYRLPLVRKEFRLQTTPATSTNLGSPPNPPNLGGRGAITVAITALFPEKMVSLPNSPPSARYPTFARETWQPSADKPGASETLPNATRSTEAVSSAGVPPASPPEKPRSGIPPWVWAAIAMVVILGILLFVRSQSAKPAETKPAVAAAKTPQSRPIPGSLTVMIGQSEHLLQPLTVDGKWSLLRDDAGAVTLLDPAAPSTGEKPTTAPTGAPIANLEFDANRNLLVRADSGAQFVDLNGPDPARLDSRLLTIAPGTKAFCRIVPVGASTKTRFEVAYNTTQKGNRA